MGSNRARVLAGYHLVRIVDPLPAHWVRATKEAGCRNFVGFDELTRKAPMLSPSSRRSRGWPWLLPLVGGADGVQKRIVLANIVVRIIEFRRKYEQRGVRTVLPLPAPDHRRKVNADARLVQHHFAPRCSIVDRYAALSVSTDQKLVTSFVGVFSTDFPRWNPGNDKIPLRPEWKLTLELSHR
jgi:hypothetical protein